METASTTLAVATELIRSKARTTAAAAVGTTMATIGAMVRSTDREEARTRVTTTTEEEVVTSEMEKAGVWAAVT